MGKLIDLRRFAKWLKRVKQKYGSSRAEIKDRLEKAYQFISGLESVVPPKYQKDIQEAKQLLVDLLAALELMDE